MIRPLTSLWRSALSCDNTVPLNSEAVGNGEIEATTMSTGTGLDCLEIGASIFLFLQEAKSPMEIRHSAMPLVMNSVKLGFRGSNMAFVFNLDNIKG